MLALLAGVPVFGAAADRDQPLEISAGKVHIDGKRKLRQLSGGVEIRRGSLLIRADSIELRELPQGEQLDARGDGTTPVLFRQKREGLDEFIEGRAQQVEYDAGTEVVHLHRQAMLRRLSGEKMTEELNGDSIVYDHARESFEVEGTGTDRVRAVVAPRPGADANASSHRSTP